MALGDEMGEVVVDAVVQHETKPPVFWLVQIEKQEDGVFCPVALHDCLASVFTALGYTHRMFTVSVLITYHRSVVQRGLTRELAQELASKAQQYLVTRTIDCAEKCRSYSTLIFRALPD